MKSLMQQHRRFTSTGGKVLMALIFTLVIGFFSIPSSFAEHGDDHGRGNRHEGYGHRGWHGDRDRDGYGGGGGYGYQQPYIYAQPVYVPPPVYYPPQQSPGISLFFPLNMRR